MAPSRRACGNKSVATGCEEPGGAGGVGAAAVRLLHVHGLAEGGVDCTRVHGETAGAGHGDAAGPLQHHQND
eukprot:7542936-Alexandrium_andersonii.AAC.2